MRNNPDAADQYAQELSRIISNYDQPGQIEPYFGTDASSQSTNLLEFCQYLTTLAKSLGKSCYIGEAGIGYTFGEVANRFATEENGYIYDLEYEEMALFLTAFAEAAQRTKLPMLIFWNYDHDAKPVERPFSYGYTKEDGTEVMIPIDRGSSTEYSWNEMYWTRGNNILRIIKNANDKYDSVTDVNSLGSLWSDADYDLSNFILDNRTEF